MKIIVLTSRFPFPFTSGGIKRIISICRYLSNKGHELTLVSYIGPNENSINACKEPELKKIFNEIYLIEINYLEQIFNVLVNFFYRTPFQISLYRSTRMSKLLKKLSSIEYDISIFHLIRGASYVDDINAKHSILEMTDSISLNMIRTLKNLKLNNVKNFILKIIYFFEIPRMSDYEKKMIRAFDNTILVSHKDANNIINSETDHNLFEKIKIIPLAVDKEFLNFNNNLYDKKKIIFIGRMDYAPNEDAVLYFSDKILPIIEKNHDGFEFKIIGAQPSQKILNLVNKSKLISVLGFVDDFLDEVSSASLSIAPMVSGSGMQTKILESMALGVPVVTNSMGYGDFNFKIGEEIIVEDDEKKFADAIMKILNSESQRKVLSNASKNAVIKSYSIDSIMKTYLDIKMH